MKSRKKTFPLFLLCLCIMFGSGTIYVYASSDHSIGWLEHYEDTMEKEAIELANQISEITDSTDAVEAYFIQQGLSVLDTQINSPSWLANPEYVYAFWEKVQAEEDAELKYISVHNNRMLNYTALHYKNKVGTYICACVDWDSKNKPYISMWETHTIQDWELTERGNFYYRIRPANDKHYVDYCVLHLQPPDPDLCQMTNQYISPVGYYSVNLFLCDWNEQDLAEMSLTDVFEYFYLMDNGEAITYESYPSLPAEESFLIPASLFEKTILAHFNITKTELRRYCRYSKEQNCYLWTPFYTNDAVQYWFPFVEPEVIEKKDNPDGTFTLTVNVSSADLKVDTVFVHEVTIRPVGKNGFQYVSNHIVSQTEYGIPNKLPRFYYRTTR